MFGNITDKQFAKLCITAIVLGTLASVVAIRLFDPHPDSGQIATLIGFGSAVVFGLLHLIGGQSEISERVVRMETRVEEAKVTLEHVHAKVCNGAPAQSTSPPQSSSG